MNVPEGSRKYWTHPWGALENNKSDMKVNINFVLRIYHFGYLEMFNKLQQYNICYLPIICVAIQLRNFNLYMI